VTRLRVYLPATSNLLQDLVDRGQLIASAPAPITGFAVTPGLRAYYADDDDEESLEYAAQNEAARASLRLLDADQSAWRRRVVIAADVEGGDVVIRDDLDRGVIQVTAPIPIGTVAAALVDDADAEGVIGTAAARILAAELGDEGAQDDVDDAEGFDLSWYASQEIGALLDLA
jgi:hypothetical protein